MNAEKNGGMKLIRATEAAEAISKAYNIPINELVDVFSGIKNANKDAIDGNALMANVKVLFMLAHQATVPGLGIRICDDVKFYKRIDEIKEAEYGKALAYKNVIDLINKSLEKNMEK